MKERKFEHGRMVATRAVHDRAQKDEKFKAFVTLSLGRHLRCDWGDLDPEDAELNEKALESGEDRLFSAYIYNKETNEKIWIITEWDRSVTTILFPSDY
ncbi:MAG: hypothetical protein IJ192_00530 [Clostridia bacterium]|nr:hypothetical protein [Clostridia bacterium]